MSSGAVRVASGRLAVGDRLTAVPWFLSAGYGLVPIVMLAALLRLHNLQTVPELSDEMRDAIFSLPIARGESLPLANFSSYDSALFNYLEAIVFRVFGPDLRAPRVMMLVFGLLTTPLAFLCTRRAYGVGSAVLATAMLAVSPVHVIVNSRVAWGNCLTPLLTTVGFWLVYRAIRRASRNQCTDVTRHHRHSSPEQQKNHPGGDPALKPRPRTSIICSGVCPSTVSMAP